MATKRYQNIPLKSNEKNKKVTRSVIYPPIPKYDTDIYVITTPGDRIDLLAYRYYGSVNYAWIILEANSSNKDTYVLAPGTQLRIPSPSEISNIMMMYEEFNKYE